MLVAPLYARHKGASRQLDEDQWSIPWILRFCYLIRALKYIFPMSLAGIGVIDFFVTWKYCSLLPLFWSPLFNTELKACLVVFCSYIVVYLLIITLDIAPALITSKDPKMKCLLGLMMCSVLFCVSPFLLYAIFAFVFSFQTWNIESAEYKYIKWIHVHIVQYLQNDINAMSKKYFRIARDRPLRIYIIMFKALIMWLNIQLFQFLITDYARYNQEWQHMIHNMEEDKENDDSCSASDECCSASMPSNSGCCDFNFNKNGDVSYNSSRIDRYTKWCNERYFLHLRSPLAIMHEIVECYPATQIDYVNVYNLSQRHLYRYSNDIFSAALSAKHPMYAYAAIALYLWSTVHTALFWLCYHFGFKRHSDDILGYIYLIEYVALFSIYSMIIFNVLHCDRLLTIIQSTSWFDERLSCTIREALIGNPQHDVTLDDARLMMEQLSLFGVHHKRVMQITIQHYMMLHVLNLVLQNRWMSKLIIDYLYGFHAFNEGDDTLCELIKNIIHGSNRNEWMYQIVMDKNCSINEWSSSRSEFEIESLNKNLDISNLDDLPMPTDSNLIGISRRITRTPNIDSEIGNICNNDLLNTFMEYREGDGPQPPCVCHEDDKGFVRMWDELNLDAIRLQYDAFKKAHDSEEGQHQHNKTLKSLQFYFDFIRSMHYSSTIDIGGNE
eukprot:536620_1